MDAWMHTLEHSTIAQLSVHQTLSCSVTTLSITDCVVNFHLHTSASHALIYIHCFDTVCWVTKTVIRPVKILAGASVLKPTGIKGKWFVRCHYHHLPKRQKVRCTIAHTPFCEHERCEIPASLTTDEADVTWTWMCRLMQLQYKLSQHHASRMFLNITFSAFIKLTTWTMDCQQE